MKRIAIIRKERCNPEGCGNYLCIRYCPINRKGEPCIFKTPEHKAGIDEVLCIGCHICVNVCPFDAIDIINLPEEFKLEPIHRYGENLFALFSLPIPVFGSVVGIIGKNGIGKTTALKILAGLVKPNLGTSAEASAQEVLAYFKGSVMQAYLQKVYDERVKVSYKPQYVDSIPKTTKGTVRNLLTKIDEKQQLNQIAAQLQLTSVLDHDIATVSGGELQRVAIAATALKHAQIYVFDEPTSYLDIRQRIAVAELIRSLATDTTAVMVIEHDLLTLDYMCDMVHLLYGKEGSYGVVSYPRPTKAGINVYLDGYLKEENMRIRSVPIKFEVKPPYKPLKEKTLVAWPELQKQLGSFRLHVAAGMIGRNEVVGVLGENGIGKTTLVKILAGVIEPDTGVIDTKIRVSYKPQYVESTSENLVMAVLQEAMQKHTTDIIEPLHLQPLFFKKINQLSGGELQRVAIAEALSRPCDLVLLDEPSAYLDVEQRVIVSKIIKNIAHTKGVSILVVDHDVLFLDYVSQRLLVFEGTPAVEGNTHGPLTMEDGMNALLSVLGISMRRDEISFRPRINKPGSQKDREQKLQGKLYYG